MSNPIISDPAFAVFCDFDGTFVVQDVGSGLARIHLSEKRQALWARLESGELDAWTYAESLFTGFDLPEEERLAYLDGIELDPGAPGLLELCARRGWPFEILSDGFDANITLLRRRFGLDFAFRANSLRIDSRGWQLAPGGRNAECTCGTGLCKRAVLEAYREAHPSTLLVHVGNGRISDLCAGLVADRVFAKDSLIGALERAGRSFERFETLADVSAALEGNLGAVGESR